MDNPRGIALMTLAMACFAVADALTKALSAGMAISQILALVGIASALAFGTATVVSGQWVITSAFWQRAVVTRNLAEVTGTFGFISALAITPLATASAIIQSAPLLVTLGAVVFLGERVGWRRWSAIAFGFVGVLIIMRPGADGFTPGALLAFLGAVGLAGRDLASRAVPRNISTLQLATWGFVVLVPTGYAMKLATAAEWRAAGLGDVALLAGITLFAGTAVYSVTVAMRTGDVAAISPFRYTRLIFGIAIAMLFFGERPDASTWAGAVIIVGAGPYTFMRERRTGAG